MREPDESAPWRDREAAQRLADTVRAAVVMAGGAATIAVKMQANQRDFIAVNLGTGGWDRTLYDTRDDALRHQAGDRNQYAYIPVPPHALSDRTCDTLLFYWRRVYEGGYRPDGAHKGIWIARDPNSVEVLT